MRNVGGLRLVLEQPFQLIHYVAYRKFTLETMLAGCLGIALSNCFACRGHLCRRFPGTLARIMSQAFVIAGKPLQPFRQRSGFLA